MRLAIFVLAALALLARDVGFDFVLGALAAGLVVGLALDTPEAEPCPDAARGDRVRLPDPDLLRHDGDELRPRQPPHARRGLGLAALFLALLLAVRGLSALLWLRELGPRHALGLALFAATALPLIVAIVDVADDHGAIAEDVGASLVGAGMISVLTFPLLGLRAAGGGARDAALSRAGPRRPVDRALTAPASGPARTIVSSEKTPREDQ